MKLRVIDICLAERRTRQVAANHRGSLQGRRGEISPGDVAAIQPGLSEDCLGQRRAGKIDIRQIDPDQFELASLATDRF
jgi:hypothetical protein